VLLVRRALSSSGFRSAAAAPATAQPAAGGHRARGPAPTARLGPPPGAAHRLRAGRGEDRGAVAIAGARAAAEPRGAVAAKAAAGSRPAGGTREPAVPSSSVGHPNDGRLEGGVRLDLSRKELRVVPVYGAEDVRWGLPALVGMIERSSRAVAKRFPGAVLDVGDLSRKNGGEVHRHHSHESGRDADLGFYAIDGKGKQVHARTFVQFDARLASTTVPGARFDLARNWLLVQHMLTDPRAHVSHIFIADPLRSALLGHAKRVGVSRALLVRAQLAMMQPTGAEPNDDHMHVRISCPRAMLGRCIEIAKNAPSFRDRARAAKVLRTPPRDARAKAVPAKRGETSAAGRDAPANGSERPSRRPDDARDPRPAAGAAPAERDAAAPPAARGAAQEPMGGIDLDLFGVAARETREADPDDAASKDALDDSGALKITD
jgi:penicillin-insensitive murein DD-endopeptidase